MILIKTELSYKWKHCFTICTTRKSCKLSWISELNLWVETLEIKSQSETKNQFQNNCFSFRTQLQVPTGLFTTRKPESRLGSGWANTNQRMAPSRFLNMRKKKRNKLTENFRAWLVALCFLATMWMLLMFSLVAREVRWFLCLIGGQGPINVGVTAQCSNFTKA